MSSLSQATFHTANYLSLQSSGYKFLNSYTYNSCSVKYSLSCFRSLPSVMATLPSVVSNWFAMAEMLSAYSNDRQASFASDPVEFYNFIVFHSTPSSYCFTRSIISVTYASISSSVTASLMLSNVCLSNNKPSPVSRNAKRTPSAKP